MNKFPLRLLQMALVASLVGVVMAANADSDVVQTTAKLKPVAGAVPTVPSNATGTAVWQKVTTVNGRTYVVTETLAVMVKGLTESPDGTSVRLLLNGDIIHGKPARKYYGTLTNGSATIKLNSAHNDDVPNIIPTDVLEVQIDVGSDLVLSGKFGQYSTK